MYAWILRFLELGERRCSYCQRLMGWKWMGATATLRPAPWFAVSHGICKPCATHLSEES